MIKQFIKTWIVILLFSFSGVNAKESFRTDSITQSLTYEKPSLKLGWKFSSNNLTEWHVFDERDQKSKQYSLVKSGIGPLNLKGSLLQKDTNANQLCSRIAKDSLFSITCIHHLEIPVIELKQVFEGNEHPYQFDLVLSLSNSSEEDYFNSEEDNLGLYIGPELNIYQKEKSNLDFGKVFPVFSKKGKIVEYIQQERLLNFELKELDWFGLQNKYFALYLIPHSIPVNDIEITNLPDNDLSTIRIDLPIDTIKAKSTIDLKFTVFSGPKLYHVLKNSSKDFTGVLFSTLPFWMRWLCLGLYQLLAFIQSIVINWGLAIILLALIIKILLRPISKKAKESQRVFINAQKEIQPEIKVIKANYKGGEQSELILRLYKKYGISPFAGLKPLLVVLLQLPILIALYHLLGDMFELKDASFLWIENLSEPDKLFSFGRNIPFLGEHFNLLPVLMSIATLFTFKLAPAPTVEEEGSKLQSISLIAMTVMFFFLFYTFPAGMVLYWTFANIFHLLEHYL